MTPDQIKEVKRLVAELEQYRYCMSYDDSYFGEPAGLVKRNIRQLQFILDPTPRPSENV